MPKHAPRQAAPTPDLTGPDRTDWLSVTEAATVLGISPDAVRKRLERGQLAGEKRDGRWWTAPIVAGQDRTRPDWTGQPDRRPDTDRADVLAAKDAAIADQTAEIGWLRAQLEERDRALEARSRELAAERERADTLHRLALQRIEALTAGATPAPDASQGADVGSGATIAATRQDEPTSAPAAPQKRGVAAWWARLFGGTD